MRDKKVADKVSQGGKASNLCRRADVLFPGLTWRSQHFERDRKRGKEKGTPGADFVRLKRAGLSVPFFTRARSWSI